MMTDRNAYRLGVVVCLLFLIGVVVCILVLSWVPPVSRDALTHHLAVPKLYLKYGAIKEIPQIRFSYYPMNVDLLYIIPLWMGNDIAPKYIHFFFALLTAGIIYRYLKRRASTLYALLGAAFFLSLPVIVKLSITAYVDLGLVFFSTAAIYCLFRWHEKASDRKYLILSAICCGLALGVKYNGLICFFLLTLFVAYMHVQTPGAKSAGQFRALYYGLLFAAVALLFFSPWMIRNCLWTQNPVYPLFDSWFNPKVANASGGMVWNPFNIRRHVFGENWWQIVLVPIRIFIEGKDDVAQFFDGRLNPFLLLLIPPAVYRLRRRASVVEREMKLLLSFAVLFILYVYFRENMRIRYIAPVIPPLVMLSMLGLREMITLAASVSIPYRRRIAVTGVVSSVFVMLGINAFYMNGLFASVQPLSYIRGEVDRDTYIQKHRSEYAAITYANRHLPADARIFGLFLGNRNYYSDHELFFGRNLFLGLVKKADTSADIAAALKEKGYSNALVGSKMFATWADAVFDDRQKVLIREFFSRDVRPLFSQDGYGLFALEPAL